ncbi:MAG: YdcF family protein [Flavobacteriales bacterium]|nr:YdcF family protein [Flavobacteriales bacterium]
MQKNSIKYIIPIVILLLTSCTSLFHSTKGTFAKGLKGQPYDVIIVPGFPYDGEQWNTVIKMRVTWAKYLFDKGYTKNIIFSGGAVYTPYIESRIFKAYAIAKGVPSEHIFTEETAEHSVENIYYSYRMAKEMGFKKIALATDAFQTNNTRRFIKKYDLDIQLLPVIIDTMVQLERSEPKIDASIAKIDNFVSITKRESLTKRLSGTFGKHIIWVEKDLKKKRFIRKFKKQNRLKPS